MRFEWDEDKSRRNLAKHKVSFETATSIFDDQHALSIEVIRVISARKATPRERRAHAKNQQLPS
jgi:uncharacterized DUF497 family protein